MASSRDPLYLSAELPYRLTNFRRLITATLLANSHGSTRFTALPVQILFVQEEEQCFADDREEDAIVQDSAGQNELWVDFGSCNHVYTV